MEDGRDGEEEVCGLLMAEEVKCSEKGEGGSEEIRLEEEQV